MVVKSLDLLVVMLAVAVEFVLVATGITSGPINAVLGTLMVIVLPGYSLCAALFDSSNLGRAERVALSVGMSFCVAILGGLLLDALPSGLQLVSWLLLLGSVTMVAAIFAILRRLSLPQDRESLPAGSVAHELETMQQGITNTRNRHQRLTGLRPILFSCLAAAVTIGGIAISVKNAQMQQAASPVTQLWILPDKTEHSTLHIGIHTQSMQPSTYHLIVLLNGVSYASWGDIFLSSNATWEESLSLQSTMIASNAKVVINLYRQDHPDTIFRYVSMTLGGSTKAQPFPSPQPTMGS